ncbi:MAG: Do family serine endopeptidase [Bacteroidales bacterium]
MKYKKLLSNILIAVLTAILTVAIYSNFVDKSIDGKSDGSVSTLNKDTNGIHFTNLPSDFKSDNFDFTYAAENTVHAVVHVKTKYVQERSYPSEHPLFEYFFGDRYQQPERREAEGYGSGVIISPDGYIVTNNHVIEKSDEIEVALNDERTFEAEIVGTDEATDLALLKIDEKELPYLQFGSSKDLKLGEWVLAVGNPFNLRSTVTAGIVSAKGRAMGFSRGESRLSIESFIQTDAAVNKGNSGGALVNMEGELIGINSAIASPTGAYTGYAFAIPSNIAQKVVEDLIKFGEVKRAVLGVQIQNITGDLAKEKDLEVQQGAYVAGLTKDGAADEAGIKSGDVIIEVDNEKIESVSELQQTINNYRPGDEVKVIVKRNGKKKQFDVKLRNMQGSTEIIAGEETLENLGAKFETLSRQEKQRIGINHGVKVVRLEDGAFKDAGIKEGFVVAYIEGNKINSVDDIKQILGQTPSGARVEVEGLYPGNNMIYVYQIETD